MASEPQPQKELEAPTVTLDDLRAFHAAHFLLPPHHDAPSPTQTEANEDDGLGYYPDGAKRTLTDAQIAMFRHSEIEKLLRERRHRAEALADSDVAGPSSTGPAPDENSPHQHAPPAPATESATRHALVPGRAAKRAHHQHQHQQHQHQHQQHQHQQPRARGPSTKAQHIAPEDPQGRTHRRLARELDDVAAPQEPLALDY